MNYLLDTNILVTYIRDDNERSSYNNYIAIAPSDVALLFTKNAKWQ
jgi:hypothetical protein